MLQTMVTRCCEQTNPSFPTYDHAPSPDVKEHPSQVSVRLRLSVARGGILAASGHGWGHSSSGGGSGLGEGGRS